MNDFLFSLLSTPSVSGFEYACSDLFEHYVQDFVDECYRDLVGNSVAKICGKSASNPILIEAHIDEIGFQVVYISDNGNIYIRANGGIDIACLPGCQVEIYGSSGIIQGVIGKSPMHLLSKKERENVTELSELWVDTGLAVDMIKKRVTIGDVVTVKPNSMFLGEHCISSKALDDKIGVYVVSEVLRRLASDSVDIESNIYGVASVQEEVGFRGVQTICNLLHPNLVISIDVEFATDVPGSNKNKYGDISLGKGVVLSYCLDSDLSIIDEMRKTAIDKSIPIQLSARPIATGGTNASRIRFSGQGVKTILLGIPCRYMHTPVEVCDLRDVESAIRLITEYIKNKQ